MNGIELRPMQASDRTEVTELIHLSTNTWYQTHGRPRLFSRGLEAAGLFFDVYERLDPGCGVVAVSEYSGRLAGSCFYHPRPTHVSLGIMNVHPNYFGCGAARALLQYVIDVAEQQQKPLRLVSSAMNLDSYSLYTRAGFVPQVVFQDLILPVPPDGLPQRAAGDPKVREAVAADVPAMDRLETELVGISRQQDYGYFLENRDGLWHVSVCPDDRGGLDGFLASLSHPGFTMLGPGLARTAQQAASLLLAELDRCRGRTPLFLVPAQCSALVQQMYQWGAKNCEIHFSQVRGPCPPVRGIQMPTFLPESG
jgi:GNAT superfamily N-acetyltransferase